MATSGKCVNYDYCDLADRGEMIDIPVGGEPVCPECGKPLQIGSGPPRGGGGLKRLLQRIDPRVLLIAGGAVLLVALIALLIVLFWPRPSCKVEDVRALMALDPKASELEQAGQRCVDVGLGEADSGKLDLGVLALREAAEKGSVQAAAALGRLFDPLARKELEKQTSVPQMLPSPDPAIAVQWYDRAKGVPEAQEAAARLRAQNPSLRPDARNRDGTPLSVPGHEGLYQRILTKPGTMLVSQPGAEGGTPLETFDILYVFAAKPGWRQVGHSSEVGPEGWIKQEQAQPWNVMLAMRYTPQGARSPALFFRDETALKSVVLAGDRRNQITDLVEAVRRGEVKDDRLVAVEEESIDWRTQPYVMPILRATAVTADDGRTVYLAEIASVAGTRGGAGTGPEKPVAGAPGYCKGTDARNIVHNVVFVIDTTASMGPYIEGVRRIVGEWKAQIDRSGLNDKFRFGLVAYRNNMDDEPQKSGLEYVTRVALPLSAQSDAAALVNAMGQLSPATVSTHDFNEDAVAGLSSALEFDWSQNCGGRFVFLITDAGTLRSDDPKASRKEDGLTTIAARARELKVDIFPVHLKTPEARRAGNIERAARQYMTELDTSGGTYPQAYRPLDGSAAAFNEYLKEVSFIIPALAKEKRGELVTREEIGATKQGPPSVKELVLGRLFAVQQRFVGALAGATAPTFASSWTSDRDLANFDVTTLEVSVYLTRRQLNELAQKVDYLIRNARQARTESSRFFSLLRMVSAATAQDPTRFSGDNANLGALMPSFLRILPYKSDVLALTAEDWRAMGAAKQDDFIRKLTEKRRFYILQSQDQSLWRDIGSTDPADAVTLIPLRQLP